MTGRHADVIQAGYIASEIAHRMVVPGGEVRGEGKAEGGGEVREEGKAEGGGEVRGENEGGGEVRGDGKAKEGGDVRRRRGEGEDR